MAFDRYVVYKGNKWPWRRAILDGKPGAARPELVRDSGAQFATWFMRWTSQEFKDGFFEGLKKEGDK